MDAAKYKVLSGAVLQMRRLELVSRNLANLNTSGYKRDGLAFSEILVGSLNQRNRIGGMVGIADQRTDFSQGQFQQTGNPFDLAIEGDGFFVIQTPRGIRYTRQGTFTLSGDGTVVTPQGYALMGESSPIRVEGKDLEVTQEGAVLSDGGEVGNIRVVRFSDLSLLIKEGNSFFHSPQVEPEDASAFRIHQGTLEQSNVNPIEAMVTLILIQRRFEAYQRALRVMDGATEKMISEGARL